VLLRSVWDRGGLAVLLGATLGGQASRAPIPASYHVSPTGTARGAGTAARPWDLATALAGAKGRVRPGDTIWLHGGQYRGAFRTALVGEAERPIVFRQRAGERATIDGTLKADGAFLTFWGFEIMQSDPVRTNTYGLEARTNGGRFINLIIHDAGTMGISFWTPGEDAELYGCIVYNNGTHENLDHGVYVHNERGTKLLADNVFFDNLGYGIHVYASPRNPPQRNVRLEGNVAFNNGTISNKYRAKGNILVGGEVPMSGMQVVENLLYFSGQEGENLRLGYAPLRNDDVVVQGNLIWGGQTALRIGTWTSAIVEGNTLGGAKQLLSGDAPGGSNSLLDWPHAPATPTVVVRPNRYEPGRAHIVVYNWSGQASVNVDLSRVLAQGQSYEVRSVQDVFGPPLMRGTYVGDSIAVPMTAERVPPLPVGRVTASPPRTGPAFDVFLVTVRPAGEAIPSGRSRSRAP